MCRGNKDMSAPKSSLRHRHLTNCVAAGKHYKCEVWCDVTKQWRDHGRLSVVGSEAFLNGEHLAGAYFHQPTHSIRFGHGCEKSGQLAVSADGQSLVGTMSVPGDKTKLLQVRATNTSATFLTYRKKKDDTAWEKYKSTTMGTRWEGEGPSRRLLTVFKVNTDPATDYTATAVAHNADGSTELKGEAGTAPNPFSPKASFDITLAWDGKSFEGTMTDSDRTAYDWKGAVDATGQDAAKLKATMSRSMPRTLRAAPHPMSLAAASVAASSLSVQDLMNVSSLDVVTDTNGNTSVRDVAQDRAGQYFSKNLTNSLEQKWIDDFFGGPYSVPDTVKTVRTKYQTWYATKAVPNMGQLVHDNFQKAAGDDDVSKRIAAAARTIDSDKLRTDFWQKLGEDETFKQQSSELYRIGYEETVPGIQPYLGSDRKVWAQRLHDTITSDSFLNTFALQVASTVFKNPEKQIYEWYTQILVLDHEADELAQSMMEKTTAVVLGQQFNNVQWDDEMGKYLTQGIDDVMNGSYKFQDKMLDANLEQIRQVLQQMVGAADTMGELSSFLGQAYANWQRKHLGVPIAQAGADVAADLEKEGSSWWKSLTERMNAIRSKPWVQEVGNVLGVLGYTAGAGFLIYQLASGGATNIIADINLGLLATGFLVKSIETFMSTRLGKWLVTPLAEGAEAPMKAFGKTLGKWFTKDGLEVDNIVTKILGKSSAEFMAKRLGPVLSVVGLAVSAYDLYKAIKSGSTRDIVFESINTFLALGEVVLVGLELLGFAWAGPVGLALAIVGAIVAIVQLIWNLIDPPSPPPTPIELFISGPLKDGGWIKPAAKL